MALRVAINGFGRIGRLALRALMEHERTDEFEVVAINNSGTAEAIAPLFAFDSVHGRYRGELTTGED